MIWRSANSSLITEGSEVHTTKISGGWRAEFVIPWEEYGVRPIVGHRFGLDVHIVLEDNGERVAKLGWFDETDQAWENPKKVRYC